MSNEKRGIIKDTDDDGDGILRGWGPNFANTGVIWTYESAFNSICHLFETKEEAANNLMDYFQMEIDIGNLMIKHIKQTVKALQDGKKQIANGYCSKVSPSIALHFTVEDAKKEYKKSQRVKRLKKEYKEAIKELK